MSKCSDGIFATLIILVFTSCTGTNPKSSPVRDIAWTVNIGDPRDKVTTILGNHGVKFDPKSADRLS